MSVHSSIRLRFRELTELFRAHGFDSPETEAAYLLEDAAGIRHTLIPLTERALTDAEQVRAEEYLTRRLKHEPFQYISGWTDFRNLRLDVGPGCLIPRPETELLVDLVKDAVPTGGIVAELGTGSGAIILALADERKDLTLHASELSPDALRWATHNRDKLGFLCVRLYAGDLFSPFPDGLRFHAVVANLPYIAPEERADLPPNVLGYEPEQALFAPDRGLALLKRALEEAPDRLRPGGVLLLEIGETQGAACGEAAARTNAYQDTKIRRDQYGAQRFFVAKRRME